MMPPAVSSTTAVAESTSPIAIGGNVSNYLLVTDESGQKRSIRSYKAPINIMVLTFFSLSCPEENSRWKEMSRFYREYKGWRADFVAVDAGEYASHAELAKRMKKAELPYALVEDDSGKLTHALMISGIPELVIIDEYGNLRYRGPVGKEASTAIDAVIGHIDAVADPQPAMQTKCVAP